MCQLTFCCYVYYISRKKQKRCTSQRCVDLNWIVSGWMKQMYNGGVNARVHCTPVTTTVAILCLNLRMTMTSASKGGHPKDRCWILYYRRQTRDSIWICTKIPTSYTRDGVSSSLEFAQTSRLFSRWDKVYIHSAYLSMCSDVSVCSKNRIEFLKVKKLDKCWSNCWHLNKISHKN